MSGRAKRECCGFLAGNEAAVLLAANIVGGSCVGGVGLGSESIIKHSLDSQWLHVCNSWTLGNFLAKPISLC
jgi:hypothetical protein